ncbi:hypothetical protein C8J56DRAFT_905174 [Mycena floridula]|nr:hypothetical protein C8J56DRAFT_905174 [Mycena floridula]
MALLLHVAHFKRPARIRGHDIDPECWSRIEKYLLRLVCEANPFDNGVEEWTCCHALIFDFRSQYRDDTNDGANFAARLELFYADHLKGLWQILLSGGVNSLGYRYSCAWRDFMRGLDRIGRLFSYHHFLLAEDEECFHFDKSYGFEVAFLGRYTGLAQVRVGTDIPRAGASLLSGPCKGI